MAKSGSFNFSPASALDQSIYPQYAKFSWSASWDSTNNRWNIDWNVTAQGGQDSYKWVTTHATSSVTIAAVTGTAAGAGTKTLDATIAQTHNDDIILQGSFTLTPTSAGAAKFSVAGDFYFVNISDSYKSSHSASSDQQTLDTAALGSTITLSATSKTIGSTSDANLVVTVKSNGNYYHELSYKSDNSTSAVSVWSAEQINATTKTANITPTNILAKFPSAAGGTLTFTLKTYTSSAKTTQVGTTKTATCSITITTANFKPTATAAAIQVASWSTRGSGTIEDTLVAGYSTASSAITTSIPANTGTQTVAKINYTIKQGSTVISSGTIAGSSGNVVTPLLPASASNYTLNIVVTAVDTRGQAGNAVTVSKTVYGYTPPVITASIYRTTSSTSTNQDEAGTFVYVTYSATASSVNSKNSVQTIGCAYSGYISGNASSGSHQSLPTDKTAKYVVTVKDKVETVTKTIYIDPALFALELYDDKSGTLYAQSGGYFKTVKSGEYGFFQDSASGYAGIRLKRSDLSKEIRLLINSGSSGERGLYLINPDKWLFKYDDSTNRSYIDSNLFTEGNIIAREGYMIIGQSDNPSLYFDNATINRIYARILAYLDTTNGVKRMSRFYFRQYSYNSSTGEGVSNTETFRLPEVTADLNSSATYDILTSKNAITVSQGGTGTNSSKGNSKCPVYLGSSGMVACSAMTSLLSSSFTTGSKTLTNGFANYNYLIVMGSPSSGSAKASVVIPTAMLSTTDQLFSFSNEAYGVSFNLKKSGTDDKDVTITFNLSSSGTGSITNVYGGI